MCSSLLLRDGGLKSGTNRKFVFSEAFNCNVSHPDVFIYTYTVQRISQTQQFLLLKMLFSGRHVSTPSESSSGPLKVQIQG